MIYTLSFFDNIANFFDNISKYITNIADIISQFYDLCMSAINILPDDIKAILIVCIPIFLIVITIKIVKG